MYTKKEKTTRNEHSHSKLKNLFYFFFQILNLLRLSILGYRMDFEMFSFYTNFFVFERESRILSIVWYFNFLRFSFTGSIKHIV